MKKERLKALFDLLKNNEKDSFLNFAIAQEYLKLGDREEALIYFEKLLKNDPDYVGTYYHLGKLYEEFGKMDLAIKAYQTGIEVARRQRDMHTLQELEGALSLIAERIEWLTRKK